MKSELCAIIPVYNNKVTIEHVTLEVMSYISSVFIVDDGSDDNTQQIVARLSEKYSNIHRIRFEKNSGKGAAVQAGLREAHSLGFQGALQIDADGQHNISDIPKFVEAWEKSPDHLILGSPIFDSTIPSVRKHGRKLTKLMVALESGTLSLPDAMCGYRIYPIKQTLALGRLGNRMNFDPEALVRAYWANVKILTIPTHVRYLKPEEGGISHFRMYQDNFLNVMTHTQLILQAPIRWIIKWVQR